MFTYSSSYKQTQLYWNVSLLYNKYQTGKHILLSKRDSQTVKITQFDSKSSVDFAQGNRFQHMKILSSSRLCTYIYTYTHTQTQTLHIRKCSFTTHTHIIYNSYSIGLDYDSLTDCLFHGLFCSIFLNRGTGSDVRALILD